MTPLFLFPELFVDGLVPLNAVAETEKRMNNPRNFD